MLTQKVLFITANDAAKVREKIKTWTGSIEDDRYAVAFQVGGWVIFSNSVFRSTVDGQVVTPEVYDSWDPPTDNPRLDPSGRSQHTYFDNGQLSQRDPAYRRIAVNFFVDYALSSYLRQRKFVVEPTERTRDILSGRLPETQAEIAKLICKDPNVLDHIEFVDADLDPEQISLATRQVCEQILESPQATAAFVNNSEAFLKEYAPSGKELPTLEAQALLNAAREKPELVRNAADCVELGASKGDGNVYILIGVDPATSRPKREWIDWALTEADAHFAKTGSWPAFGHFITDARLRYHVVLGPGTGERERRFLEFAGNVILPPPSQAKPNAAQ
jgi:hypothetical protein